MIPTISSSTIPAMGAILEADDQGLGVTALKVAMELGLFEVVAGGPQRAEEIAQATDCNARGMTVLLDALCAKNLLDKTEGSYILTPTSETYLVRSGRGYCLPIYLAWLQAREKFIDFVRTGRATLDLTSPQAEDLWVSYAAPDRVRLPEFVEIVRKRWRDSGIATRLGRGAHILDLGCGSGFKSFTLLQMDPAARVTAVDSPKVLEITKDVAELMDVSSRVTFQNGDVDRPLPDATFDMFLIGSLLHYYDPATAIEILGKAYRALQPGGLMVLNAKPADEERKTDIALLSMIDVSNCAPHGQHYTFNEYRQLLEAAGFKSAELVQPVMIAAQK